jgi:Xaa-Pro aminopeptidase
MYEGPMEKEKILNSLRIAMHECGLAALIVPSNDPHQSEYVADHWMARTWASGFTGSAATVVVTHTEAGLWTDSRYFIQAEHELAGGPLKFHKQAGSGTPDHLEWLKAHLQPGDKVGIDGALVSLEGEESLRAALQGSGLVLVTSCDPVGQVWHDRPALPTAQAFAHADARAGRSRREKLAEVRAQMVLLGATSHLVVALDDIAWMLNMRGRDVAYNPVFYGYCIVEADAAILFVQPGKVDAALAAALAADGVSVKAYSEVGAALAGLRGQLLLDRSQVSVWLASHISDQCSIVAAPAPAILLKAIKTTAELDHIRDAMVQDGVALLRLCRWLEQALAAGEHVTEFAVGEQLAALRATQDGYFGESFPAIAGYAGNGAIVHYRPDAEGSAVLEARGVFLLDSGGQYENGTTDITRTFALGEVPAEAMLAYTMVLKGHIALARAQFPKGTVGYQLDPLARMHLWAHGMNYGHGTGHGVGYFLNVHEGPQGISSLAAARSRQPILPGMIISNEPGYYEVGQYGIRIENLVVCFETGQTNSGIFYAFETLSLFPIEATMINWSEMDRGELAWLADYHRKVLETLSPRLDAVEQAWLQSKCAPYLM